MTHFWTRTVAISAAACVLAACATSPQYPTQEGQVPQPREMPRPNFPITPGEADDIPAPTAQPSTGVESQALPPVTAPPPTAVESAPLAQLPPPPPPPEPVVQTRTVTAVTGKVVDAAGKPRTYKVESGDGLDSIARKLGTTRKQLAEDNDLKEPYRIKPGQTLKGPAVKSRAYVVGSGDTLYAIARRFNVKAQAIAEANGFSVDDPIRSGQKVVLPQGFKDGGPITRVITERVTPPAPAAPPVIAAAPPPRPQPQPPVLRPALPAAQPPAPRPVTPPVSGPVVAEMRPTPPPPVSRPYTPPATPARPANPIIQTNAPPTDTEVAAAGQGRFVWPIRGEVTSGFGPKGMGQRNDGLNIRSAAGTTIQSAAAGEVVYAGDQVPGFGNLVLVKHDGGWVTAYAHLSRVDVKMRQTVSQGQPIGAVGATGGVSEPQLHFEVRYAPSPKDKARPIDPALVLPR